MEALRDTVAFAEAPHADNRLVPVRESLCESDDGFEAAVLKGFNEVEELRDQLFGLAGGDVFDSHELVGFLHLFVDGLDGGVVSEEPCEGGLLLRKEVLRMGAKSGEIAAMIFDVRGEFTHEIHEVLLHDTNDVEAVRDDPGVGEVLLDQGAVGAA